MKALRTVLAVAALLLCLAALPAAALAAPDLVVATFDPPSGPVERTFAIPNSVSNIGTTGSGAGFTVSFVLSHDTEFTLADTVIGERSFASLAAGATSLLRSTTVTVPASVPGGTYYLAMAVDTGLAVAESNELNNLAYGSTPITIAALAPDLGPGPLAVSRGDYSEEYLVDASVRNYGTAPAGAFAVEYYLSADTVITTADAFVGRRSYSGLAAGAGQDAGGSYWISGAVPAGTYYLGMIVDSGNAVAELNEANNTARVPDPVTVLDLPDLAPWAFSPPQGAVERTFSIDNSVWNCGRSSAGPFTAGFYLSTDTDVTTADTRIGTRSFGGATPGYKWPAEYTVVSVPAAVPGGSYYVGMIIDPADAVAESMETNNVASGPGQVTVSAATAPDIGTTYFQVHGTGAFKTYDFRGAARNFGSAPTGPFSVAYYLSVDQSITLSDTLLGTTTIDDLAPGATADLHRFWNVPASVPPGPYYLGAILDPTNAVDESVETNNTAVDPDPEVISSLPDLALDGLSTPGGVTARTFVIESTFRNAGMAPAGPFQVEFYLSADQAISRADVLLGTRSHGGLAAGTAGPPGNTTATVPAGVPGGPYYLGVIIDPANAVVEAIEGNNVLHTVSTITVPPAVVPVPPSTLIPTDTDGVDGLYDDVNGNGRKDFADVVLYFNQMAWIAANEPVRAFDCNGNGRIDFADVVWLFNHL